MSPAFKAKLSCAYFFVIPAMAFGAFSSRMPAIKSCLGVNDSQIGWLLLCLGSATFTGLLGSTLIIDRTGAKKLLILSSSLLSLALICASCCHDYQLFIFFIIIAGIGVGFCDVAMNAQGILLERKHKAPCLSLLHAVCSLGGVAGSLAGSFFAWLNLNPFINFSILLGGYLLLMPWAARYLDNELARNTAEGRFTVWRSLPYFLVFCGIMALLCHIAEGAVGEWGSIFLHSGKGASQTEAALVFAAFTGSMVVCRFYADRLRKVISDFQIVFYGSIMGAGGMVAVLLSPWVVLCLAGYAMMGIGLGPIVPILFSRAGAMGNLTAGRASGIVSIFSYAGLLFFPPCIGILADSIGLTASLWIIVVICICMTVLSPVLRHSANA